LAAQLVCPTGLILIHDAVYANGTVDGALQRIRAAGYNVVRLWAGEGGVAEDDHLGLAVIENRCCLKPESAIIAANFTPGDATLRDTAKLQEA
jgi:hypothetical protein